ncbi:hypothetical protein [Zunongwangia sp. H14]|uniref:hypothetical protein n=1 Tax=Zunongwangia sp. H14 TaxID=3240792 RepID=UPI0035616E8B
MKKINVLILIISIIMVSCSNDDQETAADVQVKTQNACTAENPLTLDWMQDLIGELNCGEYACKIAILKSEYNSETVFYIQMTDPVCFGFDEIDLYNCIGEKVKEFNLEESREFVNNPAHEPEEIFSCNG